MKIRESKKHELSEILNVHRKAFGDKKGHEIAELVEGIWNDKTAEPILSLVAENDGQIVGHLFYTKAEINGAAESVSAQLLAPLAILPDFQSKGIGGRLIKEGLGILEENGVDLVFVLGHPSYYPKFGFKTAKPFGYEAPYPIPEEYTDAWMVQQLSAANIDRIKGQVTCCSALDHPQHWVE